VKIPPTVKAIPIICIKLTVNPNKIKENIIVITGINDSNSKVSLAPTIDSDFI
jgi:hypothetical protein